MKHLKTFERFEDTNPLLKELYDKLTDKFAYLLDPSSEYYHDGDYRDMLDFDGDSIAISYRGANHDFEIDIKMYGDSYIVDSKPIDEAEAKIVVELGEEEEIIDIISQELDKTNI